MTSQAMLALNLCTMTIIVFCVHLLLLRADNRQVYLPLAACLICAGVLLCQPVLTAFWPASRVYFLFFSLPALLALAPCFWLYVEGITHETPWRMKTKMSPHFYLASLGLVIAVFASLLPAEIIYPLMSEGDESSLQSTPGPLRYLIYGALILTFVLVLGWVLQAGFYVVKILRHLRRYRTHLKDVFASTETREAHWLTWLLVALGGMWFAAALNIVWDNIFNATLINDAVIRTAALLMIWSVAVWGLRQKPGFEEIYNEQGDQAKSTSTEESTPSKSKYTRSALDASHSGQIAQAIENAMLEDKLYLDNALSLQKLARHIHSSPNYVSQTLNETLQTSFFDFINQHRILDAKQRLLSSQASVVDIAMEVGFNAKSSFYTAFKKEVQQTPVQFRKAHQVD